IRLLLISRGIILFRPDIPRQHRRRKDACQKKSRSPFPFSSDRSHNHPSVLGRPVSWSRPFSQYSLLEKSCQFKPCLSLICCVLFYCKRPEIHFSSSDKDKIQRSYSESDPQPPNLS